MALGFMRRRLPTGVGSISLLGETALGNQLSPVRLEGLVSSVHVPELSDDGPLNDYYDCNESQDSEPQADADADNILCTGPPMQSACIHGSQACSATQE